MMLSKKGMQLATNTLVVIILGIVLLGIGIGITVKFVNQGQEYSAEIDDRLMNELRQNQFKSGDLVALLNPHLSVKRGKEAYFLLGFVNKDDVEREFTIKIKQKSAPDKNDYVNHVLYTKQPVLLDVNQDNFEWLVFVTEKNMPTGDYIFDIYVCYDGDQLGDHDIDGACSNNKVYASKKQRMVARII